MVNCKKLLATVMKTTPVKRDNFKFERVNLGTCKTFASSPIKTPMRNPLGIIRNSK